jgi:hypothetical protein
LLIEYLIYISVLAVVMGIAFGAFYRSLETSRDIVRHSDLILRTLNAGELWRADIRHAQSPPREATDGSKHFFEIPTTNGLVVYMFGDGSVWRRAPDGSTRELLQRVKSTSMSEDRRDQVTSWRWELELLTRKRIVRIRPLFTFQAVSSP